jgi:hypothetical protein
MKPNGVKNSDGGADPDSSSPTIGERKKSASAGGIKSFVFCIQSIFDVVIILRCVCTICINNLRLYR